MPDVIRIHECAFALFKGARMRRVDHNAKTAMETISIGKDREYNRRFVQMRAHHLVEPGATVTGRMLSARWPWAHGHYPGMPDERHALFDRVMPPYGPPS